MPLPENFPTTPGKVSDPMTFKLRFLLTSQCTATCAYCHNEGQAKAASLLRLETIEGILAELQSHGRLPREIVLSGGEPTLHRRLGEIARLCKATGTYVSMDSHAGHPDLLKVALPYLDELKIHVDSFDAGEQKASMGVEIGNVLTSIGLAKRFPLSLRANHPLKCARKAEAFIARARALEVDCKIIEMFGLGLTGSPLHDVDFAGQGYAAEAEGHWLHRNGAHRIFTKRCGASHNPADTLFIGVDGIRRAVDGVKIGQADAFSIDMLPQDGC